MPKPRPCPSKDKRILERRNAFYRQAQKLKPVELTDEHARYDWLRAIATSALSSTTRLVGHTLCLHGGADGSNIYPSVRTIADESGLTQTAVCKHLGILAASAYVQPYFITGRGGQSHARTFYRLTLPSAVAGAVKVKPWVDDPTWTPEPKGTQPGGVPSSAESEGTQRRSEGTQPGGKGTQPGGEGTQPDAGKALNGVEPSLSILVSQGVSQVVTQASVPSGTTRAIEKDSSKEDPELKARAEEAAARKAKADEQERERKALVILRQDPGTTNEHLHRWYGLTNERAADLRQVAAASRTAESTT